VLEAREHAIARGAKPLARLSAVLSDRSNRQGDAHQDDAYADVVDTRAATVVRPHWP